jgi:hypothetical protein
MLVHFVDEQERTLFSADMASVPRADEHISVDSSLHDEEAWNSEALEHVKSLHCRTWRVIRVYYSLRIITIHSRPVATMVMLREVQT